MEKEKKERLDTMAKELVKLTPRSEIKKLQFKMKNLEGRFFVLEKALIQFLSKQPKPPRKN